MRVIVDPAVINSNYKFSSAGTYETGSKMINGGKHNFTDTGYDLTGRRCSFHYAVGNSIGFRMIMEIDGENYYRPRRGQCC
jgi:hypothetical protein